MSFLLADSEYASSSESESESGAEGGVPAADVALETSEHATATRKTPAELLPSADSALSSVSAATASFLPPKHGVGVVQPAVESFDLLAKQEAQHRKQREDERHTEEEKQHPEPAETTRKRPLPETSSTKRGKPEAKERVKAQRTKGQAGIGSDFRAWKSETEMALRQQFD